MSTESGPAGSLPGSMNVSLTVIRGPDSGTKFHFDKPKILIGRKRGDLILRDRECSGIHASVELTPDGRFILKDLGSTNGTFLDGRRITIAEIASGQQVRCGADYLLFTVAREGDLVATQSRGAEATLASPASLAGSPYVAAATPDFRSLELGDPEMPQEPFGGPTAPIPPPRAPAAAPPPVATPSSATLAQPAPPAMPAIPAPPPPRQDPGPTPSRAMPAARSAPPASQPPPVPFQAPPAPPSLPEQPWAVPPPPARTGVTRSGVQRAATPPPPPASRVEAPTRQIPAHPAEAVASRRASTAEKAPTRTPSWDASEVLGGAATATPPKQMPAAEPRHEPSHTGAMEEALPPGVERSVYGVYLVVERGKDKGTVFPITRQVTSLGRSETDIVINDADVSRRHAALEIQGQSKYVLRDLASTNGTLLNGIRVTTDSVLHNDKIRMGSTSIKLIVGDGKVAVELRRILGR